MGILDKISKSINQLEDKLNEVKIDGAVDSIRDTINNAVDSLANSANAKPENKEPENKEPEKTENKDSDK